MLCVSLCRFGVWGARITKLIAQAMQNNFSYNTRHLTNNVQVLYYHLPRFLGTLTVEQIYQDRDQFAKLVREVAAPDVGRMGIEILSFTIKVGPSL